MYQRKCEAFDLDALEALTGGRNDSISELMNAFKRKNRRAIEIFKSGDDDSDYDANVSEISAFNFERF